MIVYKHLIVLFFALMLASNTHAQNGAPKLISDDLRQSVSQAVTGGTYPSLVVVITDGKSNDVAAFGKVSDGQDASATTLYEIGSLSKTFTALLLADAVTRGEVSLDDPVQKFLPTYTFPKHDEHAITLLDLATQSSGLPRLPSNLFPKDARDPYAAYTEKDLQTFLASHRLAYVPGEHYEYSNLGFGILGEALAHRAGSLYGKLVADRIATPLHLVDTVATPSAAQNARLAGGHDGDGKPTPPWNLGVFAGAGALKSTANDLTAYVRALMNPARTSMKEALQLVTKTQRPTDDAQRHIALGWQIERRGDTEIVWHNGMTGGYASFAGFTRDGKRGVVVLTNIAHDVTALGLDALAGSPQRAARAEVKLAADVLSSYEGRYRLAPNFELNVRRADGGLTVQATGQPELPVFASAKDEFFYKAVDAQLSFHRDTSGRVDSVTLHQNGRDMPAPRVAGSPTAAAPRRERIELPASALAAYVGSYALAPNFALKITAEGAQLYCQATAQPRVPIYASAKDEFFFEVVDAQLSFHRDSNGNVDSVTLHQNGQNVPGAKEHQ